MFAESVVERTIVARDRQAVEDASIMELQKQSGPISVGALLSRLHQHGTMRERFRLPLPQEEAHQFLLHAIQSEVRYRGKEFVMTKELYALTYNLAKWLTDDSHHFGYMMCGLCGNGKTTVVKALRTLLEKMNLRDEYNNQWELRMFDAKALCRMSITDEVRFYSLCHERMLAIDDLGCEPLEIQCYGNIYTPMISRLHYIIPQLTHDYAEFKGQNHKA